MLATVGRQGVVAVRPVSSVEAAAAALREAIASGDLAQGERLKEIPLAAQLGLSRGSVRDALRLLVEDGLVVLAQNQGATVAGVSATDLMELYALRLNLGTLAIRRVVHEHRDLTQVNTYLAALKEAVHGKDAVAASRADFGLQDALVRTSGLARTADIFARTTLQLRAAIAAVGFDFTPSLPAFHRENARVVKALRQHDADGAVAAYKEKLETWVQGFVRHLDGDFDAAAWVQVYSPRAGTPG